MHDIIVKDIQGILKNKCFAKSLSVYKNRGCTGSWILYQVSFSKKKKKKSSSFVLVSLHFRHRGGVVFWALPILGLCLDCRQASPAQLCPSSVSLSPECHLYAGAGRLTRAPHGAGWGEPEVSALQRHQPGHTGIFPHLSRRWLCSELAMAWETTSLHSPIGPAVYVPPGPESYHLHIFSLEKILVIKDNTDMMCKTPCHSSVSPRADEGTSKWHQE